MEKILITIGAALIFTAIGIAIKSVMDTPMVMMSHSTLKCTEVRTPDGLGDCNNQPKRSELVWVQ